MAEGLTCLSTCAICDKDRQSARISRMANGAFHKWLGILPEVQPPNHYHT